jgi:hypothetical protein
MLGLRISATAVAASVALAGLAFTAPVASAKILRHPSGNAQFVPYGSAYSLYEQQNESVFPNTEDHSAECINGYRWQRHNHDWYKTEAQDSMPLPCR